MCGECDVSGSLADWEFESVRSVAVRCVAESELALSVQSPSVNLSVRWATNVNTNKLGIIIEFTKVNYADEIFVYVQLELSW